MAQVQAINTEALVGQSINALTLAQNALNEALNTLKAGGIDPAAHGLNAPQVAQQQAPAANRSNGTKSGNTSSGGRIASPAQQKTRELITQWCQGKKAGLFTIKTMTEILGDDRIQTRNAIAALETAGVVKRWAEKLPEGRGAREIIYAPVGYDVGL